MLSDDDDNTNTTTAFADELSIIEGDPRASIETKTNNVLTTLKEWCAWLKLTICASKILMKRNLQRDPLVRLGNQAVVKSNTTDTWEYNLMKNSFSIYVKEQVWRRQYTRNIIVREEENCT